MTTIAVDRHRPPLLDLERRPDAISVILMLLGALGAGVGLAFVFYKLFMEGHAAFNTSSDMAWGSPIAFYLFFLLTSSGLSIFASLDTVFGVKAFYPLAKRCLWMAIIALVAGFSILAIEIGRPFRMLWVLPLAFQYKSPMWWMGVFYSLDLVLLCLKFWEMHRRDWHSRYMHGLSYVSFVVSICAAGTLGLVFGMMAMRLAWYSPVMPMYFILLGFTSGLAFLTLFTHLLPRNQKPEVDHLYYDVVTRLFFVSLLAVIGIRVGQIITTLWSSYEGLEAHWLALRSPFFHIEIWIGLVIPTLLLSTNELRAQRTIAALAALLFMIGFFFGRLEFLIMGQKVPLFRGYWAGWVEYWPSMTEWMLVPTGIGIFLFLYGAGNWLLRLSDSEANSR